MGGHAQATRGDVCRRQYLQGLARQHLQVEGYLTSRGRTSNTHKSGQQSDSINMYDYQCSQVPDYPASSRSSTSSCGQSNCNRVSFLRIFLGHTCNGGERLFPRLDNHLGSPIAGTIDRLLDIVQHASRASNVAGIEYVWILKTNILRRKAAAVWPSRHNSTAGRRATVIN